MPLLDRTRELLRELNTPLEEKGCLLAVSGGVDSMTLLDLLHRCGLAGGVAHFDHGLRSQEEAKEDRKLVEEAAKERGLPFFHQELTPPRSSPKGIQHWAREERYRRLYQLLSEKGFKAIATGHHADDRLETVLMGLIRGSGYRGIVGVPTEKDGVIRPLIRFSKDELHSYASERGVPYHEDPSNRSDRYLRNRIREQLLPALKEGFPDQKGAIMRSMELLEEAGSALEELGKKHRREHLTKEEGKEEYRIPIATLQESPQPRFLLFELLHPFGFPSSRIEEVLAGLERQPGARFPFNDHVLIRDRKDLIIVPQPTSSEDEEQLIPSPEDSGTSGLILKTLDRSDIKDLSVDDPSKEALLELDRLDFPLKLRKVRKGDRFRPLGMQKGSKTVLEHLTDRKKSLHEKENARVLSDAEGKTLWVLGGSIDDRFKVSDGSSRVLYLGAPSKPSFDPPRSYKKLPSKVPSTMENDTRSRPAPIPKEKLDQCHFPSHEVLQDPQHKAERRKMLERATSMGNTEHTKFKIIFEDEEGPKQVETTIWATGEKHISLKHGMTIPIHRIRELRIL